MGDDVTPLPGIYDQVSYDALARRVLTGHGFSYATDWWPMTRANEPTAHFSFLYTLYLAGVYAVFGLHPLAARIIQAVVGGVLLPWLLWRIGRRLFGEWPALVSAAIGGVYVYFFYYAAALMTETFFILAVLASLDLALALVEAPSAKRGLLLGLALGAGILVRQTLLLFAPFLLLGVWWQGYKRVRWFHLLLPILIIVLLIAPWTIRNYYAFGRFVLLNTNAGFAFYWANHPQLGADFSRLSEGFPFRNVIPQELAPLNEAAMEAVLLRQGLGFVAADPGRYLLLCLGRFIEYFKFWPSPESGLVSNISRIGSFGLFLPFMLYGLALSFRAWRRYVLLYLFIVVYCGIHLLTWAGIRYRLPVDAVLLPFAGLALVDLARRVSCWRDSGTQLERGQAPRSGTGVASARGMGDR